MQVEQSQISTRSASSANQNTGFRRKVALGQVSFIDIVFPLMDNIMQHTQFPFILTSFVALFFYLQVVFSALWPVSKFWNFQTPNMTESKTRALALAVQNLTKIDHLSNFSDLTKTNISMKNLNESIFLGASKLLAHEETPVQTEQSTFAKIFNIVQIVFWFTEHNPTRSYLTYELVVLAVITVICWGFIGYSLFRYHSLHRFEKWLLYATRAILEVAAPILFHPAAAFTGSAIKLLVQTKETILWAYVVVGIFVLVCCIALFISGFMLSSVSAYLNVTHYSMFDPTTLCTMGAISSLFITFSFIASLFPDWLMNFLQALHLVASAVIIFMMSYMPFHKLSGTCIAIAALETGALLDITMIIFINVDNVITQVPDYAPFVMMIALFIISAVLTGIYLRACKKKIVKNLTNNRNEDGERMTEEEKNERFMSLGLHLNESKALMYLRVGFQNHCDLFIDWSLLRFIASNYQTNSAIAACVQILAFFPGESRQLNAFFNSAIMKRNLGYSHRFLIFQVYRIKTLRQSSASSDANEKLAELKRLSQQCEAEINGFWASNDSNPGYFEVISTQVQSLNALWLEAIRDFPNNSKFSDEYCRFLTECATDFEMAIVQKQRSEMIEMGTNFSVDISFRSMVKNYPEYLKKDILDLKGNVRSRTTKNKGSTASSGSNKDSSFSTSNIEVDAELENSLGKLLFRHSKLRIALHHSLKGRTLQSMTLTPVAGAISVIASFAAFIGLFVYFKQTYQERGTSMDRLNFISKTRFNYAVANIILLCDFLEQTGRMNNFVEMDTEMLEEDDHDSEYIDHHIEYSQQIMDYNILSRDNFTTLLDEISILSFNGIEVYDLAGELFNDMVNITTCYDNQQLTAFANNMKNLMVLGYLHQSELAGLSKKDLFYNDEYCEILANWNSLQTAADSVFRSFSNEQVTRGNYLTKTGELIMIVIPIILFLITSIPILSLSLVFFSSIIKYSKVLSKLDHDVKEEAKKPLRRDCDDENIEVSESKIKTSIVIYILLAEFLVSAFLTIISILMVVTANSTNATISNLNRWEFYAAQRLTLVAECLHQTLLVAILNESITTRFTTRGRQKRFATNSLNSLRSYNENLLQGTETMEPCYNADDLLDEYNIRDACTDKEGKYSLHNLIKCASANQVISVFADIVQEILLTPNKFNGSIDDATTITLVHLCNVHLWKRLDLSLARIVELGSIQYSTMMSTLTTYLIVGMIVSLITFALSLYTQKRMEMTFNTIKILIKKLPPLQIVNNKALLNLLLNRESIKKEDEVSVNSSIVRSNLDGIFCTGISGVVEIVNPAVSTILGYTPEQLLGQPIEVFFNDKEAEKLNKQMTLMRNGQSANTFEDHTVSVTDSGNEVPCHLTILGMTNSHDAVESFVIILRDETELLNNQREAELAKQQSENLLYQILPRSIVTRLNQGEKDISFTVPSASISFIDIVKFSDYAALLTPEEIMGNLSTVFAAFDRLLEKYPLIIKIKLIGDVYMSASGLFSPEEPPQSHAEQMIRFTLDCLQELDEINVKLNANLCVRIGVNSGGPLIAGVLGTDKPVFDIIGDPINIASRLQSTDVPGRVQIPQSTYDLISGMNFDIEERGEVFLKGKGKTLAYFVKPLNIFMAQMSSSSEFKNSGKVEGIPAQSSSLSIASAMPQQPTIPPQTGPTQPS